MTSANSPCVLDRLRWCLRKEGLGCCCCCFCSCCFCSCCKNGEFLTIDPTECTEWAEWTELIESTDDLRPRGGNSGGLERTNFRSWGCSHMCIGVVLMMGAELGDDTEDDRDLVAMGVGLLVDTTAVGLVRRRCWITGWFKGWHPCEGFC